MNRVSIAALSATLILALSLGTFAQAEETKPLAVLSLSSQQSAVAQIADLGALSEAPDLPAWMAAMFKLYAEGQGAQGLDDSRPWGAVFKASDTVEGYGFAPVSDAEALSRELEPYIEKVEQVEDNLYRVVGKQANQVLYAKVTDKWLFAAKSREMLNNLPSDPTALLGGLDKQFDVAFRVNAEGIPATERYSVNEALKAQLGLIVREIASDRAMEVIGGAMEELDSITLGWRAHKK